MMSHLSTLHQWKQPGAWDFCEVPSLALANGETTTMVPATYHCVPLQWSQTVVVCSRV